ncbi:MAG: hypothetical protein WA790_09465 [Sulfitobacter sp.]
MISTKTSVGHGHQFVDVPMGRPRLSTRFLSTLCVLMGAGWKLRKSLTFTKVSTHQELLEVGAFRVERYGKKNKMTLENDFDASGLDNHEQQSIIYVARFEGKIIATIRGVPGAPLSEDYFGKAVVNDVVGNTDDFVEIGRLAMSSEAVGRKYGKSLIIFSILDLFVTHGYRKYVGYFKVKTESSLKYMKSSNLHRLNYDTGTEEIPYVLFFGSTKTLVGQIYSVFRAARRSRK